MISPYPHLIDLNDYPVSWWKQVVDLGEQIKNHPEIYAGACSNKIMATLFYEPSTRTQMSFQTAMLRLGGRLIGFDNPANSSVSKGETLKDTTKIVSGYADILVMRHPVAGAAKAAALSADCPVINAGDSGHLHPTQTLTDLLTLQCEKGRLDHLTIGLCGDLINGRTVHSLLKAMSCFEGNHFILISTPELGLPSYVKDILNASNCDFEEVSSLEEVLPKLDVLYTDPAGAFCQPRGISGTEGHLYPDHQEDAGSQERPDRAAPAAPRGRNRSGSGRRPPCDVLQAGKVWHVRPHGTDHHHAESGHPHHTAPRQDVPRCSLQESQLYYPH